MGMNGLRLCRDCRWQRRTLPWLYIVPTCVNHEVAPVLLSMVTGRAKQEERLCSSARCHGPCGPDGQQWSPR
jgi:hypothetical protein